MTPRHRQDLIKTFNVVEILLSKIPPAAATTFAISAAF